MAMVVKHLLNILKCRRVSLYELADNTFHVQYGIFPHVKEYIVRRPSRRRRCMEHGHENRALGIDILHMPPKFRGSLT